MAEWEFLTGRRQQAVATLQRALPALQGDAQAAALCDLAIWKLQSGDETEAAGLAARAVQASVSDRARALSALCVAVADRRQNADSAVAQAYRSVFARDFRSAAPEIEKQYLATDPMKDGQVRSLLAWALVETGRNAEASKLLALYPFPFTAESPFSLLVFPRYLFLRAVEEERGNKRAEARRDYKLFLEYSGDVTDIFGDEARARKSLTELGAS
jgi:hypothetical protein